MRLRTSSSAAPARLAGHGELEYRVDVSRAAIAILISFAVAIGAITHGGFLVAAIGTTTSVLAGGTAGPGAPDPSPSVYEYDDEDLGAARVYWVDGQGVLDPLPPAGSREEQVWETFLRVTSISFAAKVIGDYTVGDNPQGETLAYVAKYDDSPYWTLAVNLAGSDQPEVLIPTLVHEYAHLLSLGRDQMEAAADDCATLDLVEGCLRASAALWAFQGEFWSDLEDAPAPDNGDWDVTDEFYARYEDQFVSDYAATNVIEDFAETFMVYVIEDAPTGDSVAADKLRFMATVPGFPAIRDRIRGEFADDLGIVP